MYGSQRKVGLKDYFENSDHGRLPIFEFSSGLLIPKFEFKIDRGVGEVLDTMFIILT